MNENLEKLRVLGVQKIHEKTHIARKFVQDLLDENYSNMNSVQYSGFLSILEKEYKLDLGVMKQKAKDYYSTQKPSLKKEKAIKEVAKSRQNSGLKLIYVIFALALFVLFALYLGNSSANKEVVEVDNSVIESAKEVVIINNQEQNKSSIIEDLNQSIFVDENVTADKNITQQLQEEKIEENATQSTVVKEEYIEEVNQTKQPVATTNIITIKPKEQIWLGYIDLSNYKKSQKLFSSELELDANKEWLLYFGHRFFSIRTPDETKEYNSKNSIRFLYKNGTLKELSSEEFIALNKGQKW